KTTWYRGKIEGKGPNVWLSANQVEKVAIKESKTSLLGHINSAQVNIYKEPGGKAAFKAGEKHTNKLYYIKKQAKYDKDTYYQINRHHTGTKTIGWIKSSDVKAKDHLFVGRPSEKLNIKGNGRGTRFAWGGKQDAIHSSMKMHKNKLFHLNMEEKIGNTTWYRGKIEGKGANVWLNKNQVSENTEITTTTDYGLKFNDAVNIQVDRKPFVMNGSHGFIAKSQVNANNTVKKGTTNVRTMPQTNSHSDNKIIKKVTGGTKIKPIAEIGGWYAIEVGGSRKVTALPQQIKASMNPDNHLTDAVNKFQFLDLRKRTGLSAAEMNRELAT